MAAQRPLLVILRAIGLGDLLTVVPALRAVADAFPLHRRVLATTAPLVGLSTRTGTVNGVVAVEPLAPLPTQLHGADIAFNLHGRGPESHRLMLAARPQRLIAFADATNGVAGPTWRPGEHEVHRWCRLLTENGIAAEASRLTLDPRLLPPSAVPTGATVIHPGAASPSRRWPAERWGHVAATEAASGRTVVVTGSTAEAALCRQVVATAGLPPSACLAGTTDISGLAAAVAAAGVVLCGDTGVAHLATALARPSVVLFGPVPPAEWGPPPDLDRHVALWAGHHGNPHGDTVDPGLLAITVGHVVDAIHRLRTAV